jgi:hypothetical protein
MARTIQKKAISDDLVFSDDFDEGMLDKIEGELGQSYHRDLPDERVLDFRPDKSKVKTGGEWRGKPDAADEPMESDGFERDMPSSEFEDTLDDKAFAEPTTDDNPPDDSEQLDAITKRVRSKKILLFTVAASVLFVITAGLTYLLWPVPKKIETPKVDIVRHRIVIPDYEQEINFLIYLRTQEKEDLLKLDMELSFTSFGAHEKFKEKQAYYTDFIYGFLRNQSPPDNSVKDWVKILEEDLPERLKNDCPEMRLNAIHMKSFSRL